MEDLTRNRGRSYSRERRDTVEPEDRAGGTVGTAQFRSKDLDAPSIRAPVASRPRPAADRRPQLVDLRWPPADSLPQPGRPLDARTRRRARPLEQRDARSGDPVGRDLRGDDHGRSPPAGVPRVERPAHAPEGLAPWAPERQV